ncbi:MAG TPA: hypothetical protein PLX25_07655, partial [Sphaerochaeta sp.]|nr:hypothetical protein [Sphaerochaeta sp.]
SGGNTVQVQILFWATKANLYTIGNCGRFASFFYWPFSYSFRFALGTVLNFVLSITGNCRGMSTREPFTLTKRNIGSRTIYYYFVYDETGRRRKFSTSLRICYGTLSNRLLIPQKSKVQYSMTVAGMLPSERPVEQIKCLHHPATADHSKTHDGEEVDGLLETKDGYFAFVLSNDLGIRVPAMAAPP